MFGSRLRALRKEKRLTMKEFGEKFSLAESTISGYENGNRKPDMDIIQSFADYFDVTIDYLLGRTDKRNSHDQEGELLDPKLNIFFKEIKEESPERQEQLRKIWEIIKNEGK